MEKPDYKRCQAETYHQAPFGIAAEKGWIRCKNLPSYIAMERKPGEDGEIGSMSLCESCKEEFLKTEESKGALLITIKEKK